MPVHMTDNRRQSKTALRKMVQKKLTRGALLIEREAKLSMKGGGKPHGASQPGHPPHVDTGRLRSSITHEVQASKNEIIARVGTNVVYGKWLELGTSRMQARPWLRPAFEKGVKKAGLK